MKSIDNLSPFRQEKKFCRARLNSFGKIVLLCLIKTPNLDIGKHLPTINHLMQERPGFYR